MTAFRRLYLSYVGFVLIVPAYGDQYEPTWESLANYEAPEWYEDAKLGFWVHWGVYSVPAYMGDHASEWYGRWMYSLDGQSGDNKGLATHNYHIETYGDPRVFGYKDFIPMFKAEHFDAEEWADLCAQGGAKYFTMMGTHHDSFCLWNTELSKWNSVDLGPKRDLVGEIAKAVRGRGLKFGVSNHSAWNYRFFEFYHRNGYSDDDPQSRDLYGSPITDEDTKPSKRDVDRWLERTKELCDLYQPDLYYFDWGHGPNEFEPGRREFGAHYYNKAVEWGKGAHGSPGVVLNYKYDFYKSGSAVKDIERGRMKGIAAMVWQTDDCVYDGHTWGYSEGVPIKSTNRIIDEFVDIVSKRGVLMLSFAPKPDGSFPEDQKRMIRDLGRWLKINGEAIYATRPFIVFKDGDNVRYTRNKSNTILYAILLDWPNGSVTLETLGNGLVAEKSIESVMIVGSSQKLSWELSNAGLKIDLPTKPSYEYAFPIRIRMKGELPHVPSVEKP